MPFICNTNQLTSFHLNCFFQIGYWNLGLIPIIPQNLLKLYAKKSTLNVTKFASLKKISTKIITVKRNIQFWDVSDLSGFIYTLIFQTFYHTSLVSPKQEIDEKVNFRNFCNCSQINFLHFYGILAPRFLTGKMKVVSDMAHEVCCNGHHLYTFGKLINMSATRR